MATGVYTNFQIRDELYDLGFIERLTQNTAAFNERSRGAIRLVTQEEEGHYAKSRFFDRPTGFISRRDISSTSAATPSSLTQDEVISVKLNRGFYFQHTLDSWRKLRLSPEEMSLRLGQIVADEVTKDYLNAAINAVEAALSAETSDLVYDYSGTGSIVHAAMITALSKMGDAGDRIVCWLTHSKPFYDLMAANVTVASGNIAGMTLIDAQVASLNRPMVVTDSSYLSISGTPTDYITLGLQENAVVIKETERPFIVSQIVTGKDNLMVDYQGELAFNVEVKGYKWDTTNGGINPTDAAVGTATNWDAVVANKKDKAGVYLRTQ